MRVSLINATRKIVMRMIETTILLLASTVAWNLAGAQVAPATQPAHWLTYQSRDLFFEVDRPPAWDYRMAEDSNEVVFQSGNISVSVGEFHPEALTDPYVTLWRHTALHSFGLSPSRATRLWRKGLFLNIQLAEPSVELCHPLVESRCGAVV
jgi:hypothetical protein